MNQIVLLATNVSLKAGQSIFSKMVSGIVSKIPFKVKLVVVLILLIVILSFIKKAVDAAKMGGSIIKGVAAPFKGVAKLAKLGSRATKKVISKTHKSENNYVDNSNTDDVVSFEDEE